MNEILLVVHLLLALGLIGVVLLQRSEGGALGIGGGGGMSGFLTGRSTANFLTRVTAVLAGLFMVSSLVLTILVNDRTEVRSLTDQLRQHFQQQPAGSTDPAPQPGPKVE